MAAGTSTVWALYGKLACRAFTRCVATEGHASGLPTRGDLSTVTEWSYTHLDPAESSRTKEGTLRPIPAYFLEWGVYE